MRTYDVWDDFGEVVQIKAASPEEAARVYVATGDEPGPDYGWSERLNVLVEDVETEKRTRVPVVFDPIEPSCEGDQEHAWVDHGTPLGNGGGVIYTERCSQCGCERRTDTWHTDRHTGEPYRAIRYDDPEEYY